MKPKELARLRAKAEAVRSALAAYNAAPAGQHAEQQRVLEQCAEEHFEAWDHDTALAALDHIERLEDALRDLVGVCERNIYPQPDKPESSWAKLQRARAALGEGV